MNPIQTPETVDGRCAIYDIHCKDTDGTDFIIEMQARAQAYFKD